MFSIVDDLVARMCLAAMISKYETGNDYEFAGVLYDTHKAYKPGSDISYRYENRQDMNMLVNCDFNLTTCTDYVTMAVPGSFNPAGHGLDLLREVSVVNGYRRGDLIIVDSSPGFMCVHKYYMSSLAHEIGTSLSAYSRCRWEHDHFVSVLDGADCTYMLQSEDIKKRPCSSDRIKLQASSEVTMCCIL